MWSRTVPSEISGLGKDGVGFGGDPAGQDSGVSRLKLKSSLNPLFCYSVLSLGVGWLVGVWRFFLATIEIFPIS